MGLGKKVTIGYRYRIGMHMVFCHGPIDELIRIEAGERVVWSGSVTSNTQLQIDKRELFGGDKKEGGIEGQVDIEFGESSQTVNPYLSQQLVNTPSFRGVFGFVLRSPFVTSMSPYPKPWAGLVRRQAAPTWNPGLSNINSGSANPAHIIYETITNSDWGLGWSSSNIDDTQFTEAAQTLFDEGLGLSLLFANQSSVQSFIEIVLSHINGIFYTSRTTGQFVLRLARESTPAQLAAAPIFTEDDDCIITEFSRPSYGELVNEIILNYRPKGARKDRSVTVQNLASVQAQGGKIISQTISLTGIDTEENAIKVALREVEQRSSSLASIKLDCNRKAWDVNPGDIIKVTSTRLGFTDLVVRVYSADYGDLDSGTIRINGTEDIYSLPTTVFTGQSPSGWADPVVAPVALTNDSLDELTFYAAKNLIDASVLDASDSDSGFISYVAQLQTFASQGYELYTRTGVNAYELRETGSYAPIATIVGAVPEAESQIIAPVTLGSSIELQQVELGSYAKLNEELIRIDGIDTVGSLITFSRGALDTIPNSHVAGSIIQFIQDHESIDDVEYMENEIVEARALTRTGQGLLSLAAATTSSVTIEGRQGKPYPPGKIQIAAEFYPASSNALGGLVITWEHKDKQLLLGELVSWEESGTGGAENGVFYQIEFLDEDSNLYTNPIAVYSAKTYTLTAQEELDLIAVNGNPLEVSLSDRVLVTSGIANEVGAVGDTLKTLSSNNIATRVGSNWILNQTNFGQTTIEEFFPTYSYVDGTTGQHVEQTTDIFQTLQTTTLFLNPFNLRDDVVDPLTFTLQNPPAGPPFPINIDENTRYIVQNNLYGWGSKPNWNITFKNRNAWARAIITDQRDNPSHYVYVTHMLEGVLLNRLSFNKGNNGTASLHMFSFFVHTQPSSNFALASGAGAGAGHKQLEVGTFLYMEEGSLDDTTSTDSFTGSLSQPNKAISFSPQPPALAGNWISTNMRIEQFYGGTVVGNIIYITYRGASEAPIDTTSSTIDMTNLCKSHFTASSPIKLHEKVKVVTSRISIDGSGNLALIDTIDGYVHVRRSNVADDRAVEWIAGETGFRIVDTSIGGAGSPVSTVTNAITDILISLDLDYVNGHIFLLKTGSPTVVKMDLTGVELATTAEIDIGTGWIVVTDNFVYTGNGRINKNLTGTSDFIRLANLVTVFRHPPTFSSRPDDDLVFTGPSINNNDEEVLGLVNELGGVLQPIVNTKRQNGQITMQMKSIFSDGVSNKESHQTFTHTIERSGYGYSYGNYYGE